MKIKDGFKFGIGFLFAYDLYKTLSYISRWADIQYKRYKAEAQKEAERLRNQQED